MKEFYINLCGVKGKFIKSKGEDVIDAATKLYEKFTKNKKNYFIAVLGQGYESNKKPTKDNMLLFLNEIVLANAGDHEGCKAMQRLVKELKKNLNK